MSADLSELRDIHLPDPVPWWPPAPGWWLLPALVAALLLLGLWLARQRRRNRWRRAGLMELARLRQRLHAGELDPAGVVRQLSILLRRVALTRFPRAQVAALHGDAWLAFLDAALGRPEFTEGPGRLIALAPYQPVVDADPEPLLALAERWLRSLPQEAAP